MLHGPFADFTPAPSGDTSQVLSPSLEPVDIRIASEIDPEYAEWLQSCDREAIDEIQANGADRDAEWVADMERQSSALAPTPTACPSIASPATIERANASLLAATAAAVSMVLNPAPAPAPSPSFTCTAGIRPSDFGNELWVKSPRTNREVTIHSHHFGKLPDRLVSRIVKARSEGRSSVVLTRDELHAIKTVADEARHSLPVIDPFILQMNRTLPKFRVYRSVRELGPQVEVCGAYAVDAHYAKVGARGIFGPGRYEAIEVKPPRPRSTGANWTFAKRRHRV